MMPGFIEHRKRHCVYLLTLDEKIVYVGATSALEARLREHKRSKGAAYNKVFYKSYDTKHHALVEETRIIRKLRPALNLQGTKEPEFSPEIVTKVKEYMKRVTTGL